MHFFVIIELYSFSGEHSKPIKVCKKHTCTLVTYCKLFTENFLWSLGITHYYNGEMCTHTHVHLHGFLCRIWTSNSNHRTHSNDLKVLKNKHATKRITFDSFKLHLHYLHPTLMKDVFVDIFGRKNLCLVSYLESVCPFWILGVIFEKMSTIFWAVKPIYYLTISTSNLFFAFNQHI